MKYFSFLLLFIFGLSPLYADEEIDYLIKSMSWTAIKNTLAGKNNLKESEVYAMYKVNAVLGDDRTELKYLAANIRGVVPQEFTPQVLQEILDKDLKYQSIYVKLSVWYLYRILEKGHQASSADRIRLLEKIQPSMDPVYKLAQTAILKTWSEQKHYDRILAKLASLNEYLPYIMNDEIRLYEARALTGTGKSSQGLEKYKNLLATAPSYICAYVVKDLENRYGSSWYKQLPLEYGVLSVPYLGSRDRLDFYRSKNVSNQVFTDPELYRRAGKLVAELNQGNIQSFIKRHKNIDKFDFMTVKIAGDLYSRNQYSAADSVLSKISSFHFPDYYHLAYRVAQKRNHTDQFIENIIKYLNLEPFDSYAYDSLVEKLISLKGRHARKYYELAIDRIPNLPQKGRIVYWYLRHLKEGDAGKQDLADGLKEYYKFCPGSYYTAVIHEEFNQELSREQAGLTPSDIESLNRYLSAYGTNPQKITHVSNANGYLKESIQLAAAISDSSGIIRSEPLLRTAAEYTAIGEYSMGRSLVDYYFEKNNLNDLRKYEVLVGLGDYTRTYFLSVYYTRMLLRAYRIPDDPVLLPLTITSRLFPRPHRGTVQKYSEKFNIDEDIIYAIMRQESQFRESAVSSSNAQGLMQVMPATGKFIAGRLGIGPYSLFDPEVSIQLGAKFLSDLLKSSGDIKWASIAYNGGPGNLRKWKRLYYVNDFNHFLEKLPSKESRDYCRIILSNLQGYKVVRHFYSK